MAAKVTVEVSPNRSLVDAGGVSRRAGDRFEVVDDDTLAQWLSAGTVAEVRATRPMSMKR